MQFKKFLILYIYVRRENRYIYMGTAVNSIGQDPKKYSDWLTVQRKLQNAYSVEKTGGTKGVGTVETPAVIGGAESASTVKHIPPKYENGLAYNGVAVSYNKEQSGYAGQIRDFYC